MPSFRGSSQSRDQTRLLCLLHWQVGSLLLASLGSPLINYVVVQTPSSVWLFAMPWTDCSTQASDSSPSSEVCPNSYPLHRWSHSAISSSDARFSFCPQSFPASSESAVCIRWTKYWSFSFSIGPSNEHSGLISLKIDWFGLLLSKGLSGVFSSTTVQKNQFFSSLPSLRSSSHNLTWPLGRS